LPVPGAPLGDLFGDLLGRLFPHFGIDFPAPIGSPVLSPFDELTVSAFGYTTGGGNLIELTAPNGTIFTFRHLYNTGDKPVGTKLRRGEQFAQVGNTGLHTTGPHLHLEVRTKQGGSPVDPLRYF